ncbi:MAG: hypothetical protein V3U72_00605 [Candidatus Aenigmarchaeota archaeon]
MRILGRKVELYVESGKYAVFMGPKEPGKKICFYVDLAKILQRKPSTPDPHEEGALLSLKNSQIDDFLKYGNQLDDEMKEAVLNTIESLEAVAPSEC